MRRDPWKMALAGVAGVIVLACGGGSVVAPPEAPTVPAPPGAAPTSAGGDAKGDVAITACAFPANDLLGPEAAVKITNRSSKPSNYLVQVAFLSKDGAQQFDTASAVVNGLAPGQVSDQKATSLKREVRTQAAGGFSCKVLDVTRFAA